MFDSSLYIVVGSVVLLAAILLVVFLSSFRKSAGGARNLQGDLANMMILFQTMRDMLDQQKELARQLNESVDHKVDMIRNVVKAAADAHDELCQAQRALAEHLRHARAEIDSIQRQAATGRTGSANRGVAESVRQTVPEIPTPEPIAPPAAVPVAPAPPALTEEDADFIDHWVGLEVAQSESTPVDEAPDVSETEEEVHAARDAFRMLLNMATAQTPVPPATAVSMPATSEDLAPAASAPHGNGHDDRLGGNRALIYEYSDAGMSVGDIARELGMGKGEVRLILGLRKEEERKV